MKFKTNFRHFLLGLLLLIAIFSEFNCENLELNLNNENFLSNPNPADYYQNLYNNNNTPNNAALNNYQTAKTVQKPIINYSNGHDGVVIRPNCPCAATLRCQPCSGVFLNRSEPNCPCAPKLNCPTCPPLSLIHRIAAKKAEQDSRTSSNISNLALKLTQHLKSISKYTSDVIRLENEANEAAKHMEETFAKAQIARQKMLQTSDQAKYVAKSTLSRGLGSNLRMGGMRNNMGGMGSNMGGFGNNIGGMDGSPQVYPEQIDSVSDFLKDGIPSSAPGLYNGPEVTATMKPNKKKKKVNMIDKGEKTGNKTKNKTKAFVNLKEDEVESFTSKLNNISSE